MFLRFGGTESARGRLPREDAQLEASNALFAALKPGLAPTQVGSQVVTVVMLGLDFLILKVNQSEEMV